MEIVIIQSLLSFVLLLPLGKAFAPIDYCKNHTFDDLSQKSKMYFSKENSETEFAVVNGFKSMHCCSHGYRSIEWFKDGTPYPWSTDVSTLIISPESGNQTIYSPVISETDSGRYWCIVRNDTSSLRHDVVLKISGLSNLDDPPKPTFRPKDQNVMPGQNARFYCEAFVGNITLPDAKSEINWRKAGINGSIFDDERIQQQVISREGNQVLGSYLFITNVRTDDFGHYICTVSNTGDQFLDLSASLALEEKPLFVDENNYPSGGTILLIILLIISATISTVFLVRFGSHFRSIYQHIFQKNLKKQKKLYDALVIYHDDDMDIALKKIVFTLQNHYHYSCNTQPVSRGKTLGCKEIMEKSSCCKRLIILMSTSLTENEWTCQKLNTILENLIVIHPRIITIFLKSLPPHEVKEDSETLRDLLGRVHYVEYSETNAQNFWDLLTLGLPNSNVRSDERENVELV